ncbi:MAG: DUF499 domain-containing protein [Desulfurococcaceae archaeon]
MEGFPNVWEVCKFADEITRGVLDESKFAVELHSILDNSADDVYKNPQIFLRNTYLTGNMKGILKSVLLKLARNEGSPVYILDTEFGGGKTHTLLLLYHIFSNRDLGSNYIREYGIDKETGVLEVPDVEVVAIDCRSVKRNTLWGEIAYMLNSYESVRQQDENGEPIQQIEVIKQWFTKRGSTSPSPSTLNLNANANNNSAPFHANKPVLLLIDELPHYLLDADSKKIGNVTLTELTISFIQKLISAVSSVKNCVLVITLTGKQTLYERYRNHVADTIEKVMDSLKQSISRQSTITMPISKEDIYSVIVKRLIKHIDERKLLSSRLIDEYADYYQRKLLIDDPNYKAKLQKAYPFHPFLIDILYERVSTIESFNKTRGILRFLATVLHNIYLNRKDVKLVGTDSIDLNDQRIKDSLATLRDNLMQVIESDCIRHANELDSKRNVKIVGPIAKTILLYSLIGSPKETGIRLNELKLAVCRPSMDDSMVDNAMQEIEDRFWYIKKTPSNEYLLTVKPNINKIIYDFMNEVKEVEVKEEIEGVLRRVVNEGSRDLEVVMHDEVIIDKPVLRIVVMDYEEIERIKRDEQVKTSYTTQVHNIDDLIKEMLKEKFELSNGNIRSYQNTLIFIYPTIYGIENMKDAAKRVIACRKAKDSDIVKKGEREDQKTIQERLSAAINNLEHVIRNTYSNIAFPFYHDIKIAQIDTIRSKSIVEAVKYKLAEYGKLLKAEDVINPDNIKEIVEQHNREYITVKEIHDIFMRDRSKPFILNALSINKGIEKGVKEGLFGYATKLDYREGKYIAEINREGIQINLEGYIIRKEYVYDKKAIIDKNNEDRHADDDRAARLDYYNNVEKQILIPKPKYQYRLSIDSIDDCVKLLTKILLLSKEIGKELEISLTKGNDHITITSRLERVNELKSLIQQLKSLNYMGKGELTLTSTDKDLSKELNEHGLDKYIK